LHQKSLPNHLLQKHSHFQRQATRITHQQHQCQGAGHYLGTAAGAAHIRPKHTQKPEQDSFPPCSYTRLTAHTQFAAYTWSGCRQPKNAKTCFCILCHASMPTMSTPPQPNYWPFKCSAWPLQLCGSLLSWAWGMIEFGATVGSKSVENRGRFQNKHIKSHI